MTSRQIQYFGLIGGSLLILFVVLFFGKEFYDRWRERSLCEYEIEVSDADRIVMEKSAVEDLTQSLNDESDYMIAENIKKRIPLTGPNLLVVDEADKKSDSPGAGSAEVVQKSVRKPEKKELSDPFTRAKSRIREILNSNALFRNSSHLSETDRSVLDKVISVIETLKDEDNITVCVEGHTPETLTSAVSADMAKEVERYLKKRLPSVKTQSLGYGSQYPIIDDLSDIRNKRVEIIIRRSGI